MIRSCEVCGERFSVRRGLWRRCWKCQLDYPTDNEVIEDAIRRGAESGKRVATKDTTNGK